MALRWCHFTSLRCHSGSFRYIPVPFLSIPFHSGVILRRSGIFRFIPVYSVPFRSVPVFSNAHASGLLLTLSPSLTKISCFKGLT